MNNNVQIQCIDAVIGYDKPVAEHITFSVNKGDYLCVVGENGAGKSTLIKTLLGLLPQLSGKVEFLNGFSNKSVGYLPQQTIVQKDFPATALEVVLSGIQKVWYKPFYSKKDKEKAIQNMQKLGVLSLQKVCYRELSGGQQQRVLLARALCASSGILVLDEPVSGLDPLATQEMYKMIKELNNNGTTIIMITHDISSSMKNASHILFIGKESFFGTVKEFAKSELGAKHEHFVGGCTNE